MDAPKSIFLGFVDIAGQLGDFTETYSQQGFKVFSVVHRPNEHYPDRKYSLVLYHLYPEFLLKPICRVLRKIYTLFVYLPLYHIIMLWAVFSFDIFHFFWYQEHSNSFYLSLLKRLRKKIIVSFVGSDIRWVPLWLSELESRNLNHVESDLALINTLEQSINLESRLRNLRVFEKYASLIISHPSQAQLQLRPYYNFFLPVAKQEVNSKNNKIPIVALGIRDVNLKGGMKTLNLLKNYQNSPGSIVFELVVLDKMTHDQVIDILKRTDIFIYSPYMSSAGRFSHEAVACGAIALVPYDRDWFKYPPDAPFIHIQESTLIERLEYYLKHRFEREELSRKGIDWARKWADMNWITSDVLQKLRHNTEPDYYPRYFRDHATFNTKWDASDSIEVANKWTKYVSKCLWYKEYIESGNRDGLEF